MAVASSSSSTSALQAELQDAALILTAALNFHRLAGLMQSQHVPFRGHLPALDPELDLLTANTVLLRFSCLPLLELIDAHPTIRRQLPPLTALDLLLKQLEVRSGAFTPRSAGLEQGWASHGATARPVLSAMLQAPIPRHSALICNAANPASCPPRPCAGLSWRPAERQEPGAPAQPSSPGCSFMASTRCKPACPCCRCA